ncbi:hypothetical protein C1645_840400 [Glomus cerebriforme]|uniref:Uncharacterized protein n=1 Tax=Glomus cerebriforme TaxID=658196 RepID=A0A397S6F8_9GLOM|nr:hypothetical protein C1645_840400 [Glomus cerebriforme]
MVVSFQVGHGHYKAAIYYYLNYELVELTSIIENKIKLRDHILRINNSEESQEMICNPLQVNVKERPAKRLKSSRENVLNNSMGNRSINHSSDGYTCRNCFKDRHNS